MNSEARKGLTYLAATLAFAFAAAWVIFAIGGRPADIMTGVVLGAGITMATLAWIGGGG